MTIAFDHLFRLSDSVGLFEHAELTLPRTEHAYCVDDVARGLLVVLREPKRTGQLAELAELYLQFVCAAQTADGRFHNRRGLDGRWQDDSTVEDCWGRALWGLGTAVARAPGSAGVALRHFDLGAGLRSPWSRASAFAALGAAEVLAVRPDHVSARELLADAVTLIGAPAAGASWRWPEQRLRYANAALAEVLIAAGSLLADARALADGLAMLTWLLDIETAAAGHISVTPVGGWALGEARSGADQQPIEVACLADACARAFDVTADPLWRRGVLACSDWFHGVNDASVPLLDPVSGGGCDGLEPAGRNENQGAESTLAMIATFQRAHRVAR